MASIPFLKQKGNGPSGSYLRSLCEKYTKFKKQSIEEIIYFSALCSWNRKKSRRHELYMELLQESGISIELGKYNNVVKRFSKAMSVESIFPPDNPLLDSLVYRSFEEKKTDVNIALKMFEYAFLDKYDHAFLVTGDADITPAIKIVRKYFPDKKFTCLLPLHSKGIKIWDLCDEKKKIRIKNILSSLFPQEITVGEETTTIEKLYKES